MERKDEDGVLGVMIIGVEQCCLFRRRVLWIVSKGH